MDWTKQANEMMKTFTGTQQKIWESWSESVRATSNPNSESWQKTVESWQGTVNQAIAAQVELTRLWTESVAALPTQVGVSAPAGMSEWSKSVLEMTKVFSESQTQFSQNWFEMLKKTEPSALAQAWSPEQAEKILATWQDAAKKAAEAQGELSKMVTSAMSNSATSAK